MQKRLTVSLAASGSMGALQDCQPRDQGVNITRVMLNEEIVLTRAARIGSVMLAMAVLDAISVKPATNSEMSITMLHTGRSFKTLSCSPRYTDNPDS
jgi:hypothetical protein